jgi:hypothetical protein
MTELKELIDSVSDGHNLLYEWENKNDHEIIINFNWDDLSIRYEFSIDNMSVTKIVGEQIDFQEDVSSIDEALDIIEKDIHNIIGISESKRGRNGKRQKNKKLRKKRRNNIMKHLKKFNEGLFDKSEIDIYDLFIEFEKSRKKHINEVKNIYNKALETKDERYIQELSSYISMLKKVPANLMKIDNEYIGKVDID